MNDTFTIGRTLKSLPFQYKNGSLLSILLLGGCLLHRTGARGASAPAEIWYRVHRTHPEGSKVALRMRFEAKLLTFKSALSPVLMFIY